VSTQWRAPSGLEVAAVSLPNRAGLAERHWPQLPTRVHNVRLTATVGHTVAGLYLAIALLGLVRIVLAWRTAQQLVKQSRPVVLSPSNMELLQSCGRALRVALPELRESAEIQSPLIVGASSPVMLLPENFGRHTEDEVKAALCHELAHLRRQDYVVNLICQLVALPVAWHPWTQVIQRRIRRTREMICDAIAAGEMRSEIGYAKCLMALAQGMLHGQALAEQAQTIGLFNHNTLEERVMKLMEKKAVISLRAKVTRLAGGVTCMVATILVAAVFHVSPVMASSNEEPQAAAPPQAQAQPTPEPSTVAHDDQIKADKSPNGSKVRTKMGKVVVRTSKDDRGHASDEVLNVEELLNSDEFKRQMEDAKRQIADAQAMVNSPEFRKQIEDAKQRASEFALRDGELKKQMAELQKQLRSGEFRKQMEEANRQAREFALQSEAFRKQMAEVRKQLQSGEFKQEMEKATRELQEQLKNKQIQ